MKKTTKIIIIVFVVALLLLGIGYAAIQNITLNISGTAAADPSQSNFKVMFTGTPDVSDNTYATAGITDDTNATIDITGLSSKGDFVVGSYNVKNESTDLSADLFVSLTNDNSEFFSVTSNFDKSSLVSGETTTLLVTVTLIKQPIESVNAEIGVKLDAIPVQPGEEGSNDFNQTIEMTLSAVTNDDIGDYIDLGNNIVGTSRTNDDWRVLYRENDYLYVILADYLPANLIPSTADLDLNLEKFKYSVWSDTNRETLLNELSNETVWNSFTNGISGATAIGSPTPELLMNSYNTKNGTELVYTDNPTLSGDLYVPHYDTSDRCYGYWLILPNESDSRIVWSMYYDGFLDHGFYYATDRAARPVVSIPINTKAKLTDGIMTVYQ